MSGNRLRSLPTGLLAAAPALGRLDLSGNRLGSLRAGFFEGLCRLLELNLSDNPGAPFTLTMELARTDAEAFAPGPAAVEARVREGAPFALSAGVSVEGGVLTVTPNDDGREGFVTVTVAATDADGLAAQASFQVEVLPESRRFTSGWRLLWLKGAGAAAAAADASGGELPPAAGPQ